MSDTKMLRFGVLGAAKIARSLAAGVAPVAGVEITALASRDPAKGQAFADEFGIGRVYPSYQALLDDPGIDAVYIPLPNTMHAEWAVKAAEAGKHVLCEKPLALTSAEAASMFAAARANDVHLVEGYPYRAQPQTLALRTLLATNEIGDLQLIHASFGVTFTDPANIRLDPARGGGALLDAGSYAVSLVRLVAGACPTRVRATSRATATGVDNTTVGLLDFESGLLAQIWGSFGTAYHRHALIAGSDGMIETTYLNHPPEAGPPVLHIRRGRANSTPREVIETEGGNGFTYQVESFRDLVAQGPEAWTGATPQESMDIVATLEALAESAKTDGWVEVRQTVLD